jgi:hypothetical protein
LLTAGVGALATKAAAGLAVAAIVTAGTVEAEHTSTRTHHHHSAIAGTSVPAIAHAAEPVATRSLPQPTSVATSTSAPHLRRHLAKLAAKPKTPELPTPPASPSDPTLKTVQGTPTVAEKPPTPPVTQVTSESTELPSQAQTPAAGEPHTAETTTTPTEPVTTGGTEATPPPITATTPPPPPPPPASESSEPAGSDPVDVGTASPDPAPGSAGAEVTAP